MVTKNRVLSFMSQFSSKDSNRSPTPGPAQPAKGTAPPRQDSLRYEPSRQEDRGRETPTPTRANYASNVGAGESPQYGQRERPPSRPLSMVQAYQPPLMDVSQDTLPELQPIFAFLNSHGNKLYQEGYFLKLDDQNTHGKANVDRTWTECFAQLVGTVLSLWDAAELDAAGQDGEVLPKFINLTDASIKMIESLPTRSDTEAPLQNVLSVSTAGKNRYLLHFNSHHSLIQWTAGIRLAMFEHATLQEAYTGALIAGKGKALNNINIIMERSKLKTEDWARVRFGAGTPWRRCWCVISPPDEKEVQKLQKQINKKKSAYDRSRPMLLKGDVKFYDTKKTKKVSPIATITDAYSAFAIYPQSKPLIDASTLVKVEGSITIHSNPPTNTEGFVFVMPEAHAAVTGFEMMLRWIFPVYDTFGLYGRPGRLIADTTDPKSLMFAMPKHRRYGYLEILDVSGLILEQGSGSWRESEWRRRMKELTAKRMTAIENGSQRNSRYSSRRSARFSAGPGPSRSRVQFDDGASIRSSPSTTWNQGSQADGTYSGLPRTDSAPAGAGTIAAPSQQPMVHRRSVSESQGLDRFEKENASAYDGAYDQAPAPPPHSVGVPAARDGSGLRYTKEMGSSPDRVSSEDEQARATPVRELEELRATASPEPVSAPPAFSHAPGSLPTSKPYHSPELRRANSRMSNATLSQLAGAGGVAAFANVGDQRTNEDQRHQNVSRHSGDMGQRRVMPETKKNEFPANQDVLNEGLVATSNPRFSFEQTTPPPILNFNSSTNNSQYPQSSFINAPNLVTNSLLDSSRSAPRSIPATETTYNSRTHEPPHIFASSESNSQATRSQQAPLSQQQQAPPVPSHASRPSADSTHSTVPQPSRLLTSPSIIRKPVAAQPSISTPTSAETTSSTGSLARHVMDQTAFDMISNRNNNGRNLTPGPESQVQRQNSNVSSLYDDAASTATPDYASTRKSTDTKESVERPRAGVMRTVGNLDAGDVRQAGITTHNSAIPDINFGPTFNYASDRLALQGNSAERTDRAQRQRSPPPVARPHSAGHFRTSSGNLISSEYAHYRNDSGESRTLAWQPGMSSIGGFGPGKQQGLTAEQFVHQRAAAAAPIPYPHQRQSSTNILRATSPVPPLHSKRSSDVLAQQDHSRRNSADLLQQRPGSRHASVALGLGPSGAGEITSNLSAREQEHVARVTGTPLINMAHNSNRQGGGGLVGAIEAREKEKQQMRQGINSQAVQHAIAQRQQQAMLPQYTPQMAADYRAPQSSYGNMTQYQAPQFSVQTQRPQMMVSPAAGVFAQGGGWSAPATPYAIQPEQGSQSPQQQQYFGHQQHQQYPSQQQQQADQGRWNSGYHGQGY